MDVFCYLELLGSSGRQQLCDTLAQRAQHAAAAFQQLQQQAPKEQSSNKELLKLLRTHMSALQIQADAGVPHFTAADTAAQHAQQLLQMYAAALPLYQGMDERERGPADELLWQAAAALVAAATLTHSSSSSSSSSDSNSSSSSAGIQYLLQAVLVLEAAAKGRPYCAPVRLGLTGLYGLLGNASGAAHHFTVMDVKHVQHDTLSSHHLLPLLLGLKCQQETEGLLKSTCALFEDHLVDAGDTLMQAYRNGTHTKVSNGVLTATSAYDCQTPPWGPVMWHNADC
jgi:N-terminal acetyltransferase B complex non-catalytic subunit